MNLIVIGVCGFICCIAILAIIGVRTRRSSTGSVIDEAQNHDFIDDLAGRRRERLKKQPWNMDLKTYNLIGFICAVLFSVLAYALTAKLLYSLLFAIAGLLVPELLLRVQSAQQKSAFEERYARGLRQLASGLKSGLSIHQAIEDVCQSPFVHDSIRHEFIQLSADLKLGVPIQAAFERFAERMKCQDAADVAIAIGLQTKVGGREAEVVETIAANISSRLMLRKEIASMFAGSRATILAMDIIPFAIIAFIIVCAPAYMAPYFESPLLLAALIGLIAFMGVGSIIIHRAVEKMRKECGI